MVRPVKILIVDDHPIVRQGLAELLASEPDLVVCGEAEDVQDGLDEMIRSEPDLVIADLSLKSGDGIALVRSISKLRPGLPVIVLTIYDGARIAARALRAGARGFVSKHDAAEQVVAAIRKVLGGEIYVSGRGSPAPRGDLDDSGPAGEGAV